MHQIYTDIARRIATGQWGREFKNEEQAEKALVDQIDLPTAALLDIVRRINEVCTALAETTRKPPRQTIGPPGEHCGRFPGVKVGDVLWNGDLCEGIQGYIVVKATADGYAVVVPINRDDYSLGLDRPYWASPDCYVTVEEAITAAAQSDIEFHEKYLRFAKEAIKAVKSKGDLTRFIVGSIGREV